MRQMITDTNYDVGGIRCQSCDKWWNGYGVLNLLKHTGCTNCGQEFFYVSNSELIAHLLQTSYKIPPHITNQIIKLLGDY